MDEQRDVAIIQKQDIIDCLLELEYQYSWHHFLLCHLFEQLRTTQDALQERLFDADYIRTRARLIDLLLPNGGLAELLTDERFELWQESFKEALLSKHAKA